MFNVPKEDVIIATGHTDTKMIDKVYLHLKDEDKRKKVEKSFSNLNSHIFGGLENNNANEDNISVSNIKNKQSLNKDEIEEAKKVLTFLGADIYEYIELNDIDKLNRLLYGKYERKLLDLGVEFEAIKKIYNARNSTLKEKSEALRELINNLKNK